MALVNELETMEADRMDSTSKLLRVLDTDDLDPVVAHTHAYTCNTHHMMHIQHTHTPLAIYTTRTHSQFTVELTSGGATTTASLKSYVAVRSQTGISACVPACALVLSHVRVLNLGACMYVSCPAACRISR